MTCKAQSGLLEGRSSWGRRGGGVCVTWCGGRGRALKDLLVFCALWLNARAASKGLQAMEFHKQVYFLGGSVFALWLNCVRGSLGTLSALGRCWADNHLLTGSVKTIQIPMDVNIWYAGHRGPQHFLGMGCLIQDSPPWCVILQRAHKCKTYIHNYILIYIICYMHNYMLYII